MIALVVLALAICVGDALRSALKDAIREWLHWRRVDKALATIKRESPDFDADALRSRLEADRQRRFLAGNDDDSNDPPPMALAA